MPNLKAYIIATLYDPHANLIRKYKPRPAHSFLAQFIEFLYVQMSQTGIWITKTTGEEYLSGINALNLKLNAPASNLDWGLLIGNGTDPVNIDDHALQSPITTDINTTSHTFALSYPTPNTRRLSISRTFNNATTSPIPITEVALYTAALGQHFLCLDRTLYSVAIPASSSLELTYAIDVSV